MVTTCASPASSLVVPTARRTALIWWLTSIIVRSLMFGSASSFTASFASRHLGAQRAQVRRPEPSEGGQPLVDIAQRPAVDRVEPTLTLGPHRRETVVPQHFQMLGYRRLGDGELGLDGRTDRSGSALAAGEQFEDATPHRVAQDVERAHGLKLTQPLI